MLYTLCFILWPQVFPPWELDSFGTYEYTQLEGAERAAALAHDMRFGSLEQQLCSQARVRAGLLLLQLLLLLLSLFGAHEGRVARVPMSI